MGPWNTKWVGRNVLRVVGRMSYWAPEFTESVPETLNGPLPSTYPGPTTNTPEGAVHLSGAQHASAGRGGVQEKELITPLSIKTI